MVCLDKQAWCWTWSKVLLREYVQYTTVSYSGFLNFVFVFRHLYPRYEHVFRNRYDSHCDSLHSHCLVSATIFFFRHFFFRLLWIFSIELQFSSSYILSLLTPAC